MERRRVEREENGDEGEWRGKRVEGRRGEWRLEEEEGEGESRSSNRRRNIIL